MQQQLNVNLTIQIPEDSIIIKKTELEELQKNQLSGIYWTMKDLELRINRKSEWIKDNILYPSFFRRKLDVNNGGFVFYPERKGQNWSFNAGQMAKFLDENFHMIFKKIS